MNKQDALMKWMKDSRFSGVFSWLDYDQKQIVHCAGYAERANHRLNNEHTLFGIASGTKFFTALGIMRLVELKKLRLNDKLSDVIRGLSDRYDKSVTIEHLLTHTSGLPDYFDEEEVDSEFHLSIPWFQLDKPSDYIPILPDKDMKFVPGERFNYNNSAFILLALIIEQLTGDYYRWMDEQIIQKASLKRTGFYRFNHLPENTAFGYIEYHDGTYKTNIYNLPIRGGGDGGIYSNAADMHTLWDAFMKGDIVSIATVNDMLTPRSKTHDLSYGLGVWLEEQDGAFHPLVIGEDPGVTFESGYNIRTKTSYVVLSNNGTRLTDIIRKMKCDSV